MRLLSNAHCTRSFGGNSQSNTYNLFRKWLHQLLNGDLPRKFLPFVFFIFNSSYEPTLNGASKGRNEQPKLFHTSSSNGSPFLEIIYRRRRNCILYWTCCLIRRLSQVELPTQYFSVNIVYILGASLNQKKQHIDLGPACSLYITTIVS